MFLSFDSTNIYIYATVNSLTKKLIYFTFFFFFYSWEIWKDQKGEAKAWAVVYLLSHKKHLSVEHGSYVKVAWNNLFTYLCDNRDYSLGFSLSFFIFSYLSTVKKTKKTM